MTVGTEDGGEVAIRMYGADEFIAYQHALIEQHPEMGGEKISREQAQEQTRNWDLARLVLAAPRTHVAFDGHVMRLVDAAKVDADPRTFARAVCSCGDYTSSVDSPHGATRAWVQHWLAKTRGGVSR